MPMNVYSYALYILVHAPAIYKRLSYHNGFNLFSNCQELKTLPSSRPMIDAIIWTLHLSQNGREGVSNWTLYYWRLEKRFLHTKPQTSNVGMPVNSRYIPVETQTTVYNCKLFWCKRLNIIQANYVYWIFSPVFDTLCQACVAMLVGTFLVELPRASNNIWYI